MPWETVLVSQILILPRYSTVNCVFEGTLPPHHFIAMSRKLATLIQARKHRKDFANQGLSLPPLVKESYRSLYSTVLQCVVGSTRWPFFSSFSFFDF